jgi:hypothetical protein
MCSILDHGLDSFHQAKLCVGRDINDNASTGRDAHTHFDGDGELKIKVEITFARSTLGAVNINH